MDESGERACSERSSFVVHLCNAHESGSSESSLDVHRRRTGAAAATLKRCRTSITLWQIQGEERMPRHVFRAVPIIHFPDAYCVPLNSLMSIGLVSWPVSHP